MEQIQKFNKEIEDLRKLKSNIHELRKIYDIINEEIIKDSLKQIIITSDNIYKEVMINTEKLDKIRNFNNYYIITIKKILNQYIKINEKKIRNEEAKKLCIKIETFIPNVSESFKKVYDALFEDDVIDIDSEIKVMMSQMKIED